MSRSGRAERVIAYVDGSNLYFGLREKGWRRYYWLNIQALASRLLRTNQHLVFTKYFTARIAGARPSDPPDKARELEGRRQRQCDFLDALSTLSDFRIFEGHYLGKTVVCYKCKSSWRTHEEKMTDVQIATEMLTDAFEDRLDVVLLVSGDSDLVPPVLTVRRLFPQKRVIAAFPPARTSARLTQAAHASFVIGRGILRRSQFPDHVTKPDGYVLKRPDRWR